MNLCIDPPNERLRVDEYLGNIHHMIEELGRLTTEYNAKKLIVKAKSKDVEKFLSNGFIIEAIIKGYYSGNDAYLMVVYHDNERRTSDKWIEEDDILQGALKLSTTYETKELDPVFEVSLSKDTDAKQLATLYDDVFETYPTPMNEEEYIQQVMEEGTVFYQIKKDGNIVSAASAEVNDKYHNAEITDCATRPEFRRYGFMKILIKALEEELVKKGIFCAYSLARSLSFGMNASFHQLGYDYTGRLIKNCDISGNFEDMNVWVKDLANSGGN